jgi:hypothetical protein
MRYSVAYFAVAFEKQVASKSERNRIHYLTVADYHNLRALLRRIIVLYDRRTWNGKFVADSFETAGGDDDGDY